jgi:MinD superfamily P-loop ATPase
MADKVPILSPEKCDLCGTCISVCKPDALELFERYLQLKPESCDYCQRCIIICPMDAFEECDE